jgi:hypothetical protein
MARKRQTYGWIGGEIRSVTQAKKTARQTEVPRPKKKADAADDRAIIKKLGIFNAVILFVVLGALTLFGVLVLGAFLYLVFEVLIG